MNTMLKITRERSKRPCINNILSKQPKKYDDEKRKETVNIHSLKDHALKKIHKLMTKDREEIKKINKSGKTIIRYS